MELTYYVCDSCTAAALDGSLDMGQGFAGYRLEAQTPDCYMVTWCTRCDGLVSPIRGAGRLIAELGPVLVNPRLYALIDYAVDDEKLPISRRVLVQRARETRDPVDMRLAAQALDVPWLASRFTGHMTLDVRRDEIRSNPRYEYVAGTDAFHTVFGWIRCDVYEHDSGHQQWLWLVGDDDRVLAPETAAALLGPLLDSSMYDRIMYRLWVRDSRRHK